MPPGKRAYSLRKRGGYRRGLVWSPSHTAAPSGKMGPNGARRHLRVFSKGARPPDFGVKKHGGSTAFIVEQAFEGLTVGKKEDKLGIRSSDTCTLVLENCKVPVGNVLKGAGNGFPIAMNALDNSRIGIAAQALGIAQGAYEAALKYAHERETFGRTRGPPFLDKPYWGQGAAKLRPPGPLGVRAGGQGSIPKSGTARHSKGGQGPNPGGAQGQGALKPVLGGYGLNPKGNFPVEGFLPRRGDHPKTEKGKGFSALFSSRGVLFYGPGKPASPPVPVGGHRVGHGGKVGTPGELKSKAPGGWGVLPSRPRVSRARGPFSPFTRP
ncbi:MAG: hypothetical protein CM15mP128_0510 [Methanobacteriota archaeon]|nr:MAG: hypothetical protein CM15mP128_0510 [Euryarchaeota archaeon]